MAFLPLLGKILGGITGLGSVLGKQEQGETQGKIAQADLNQRQDQNALASYIAQQNAQNTAANTDLNRKQFESNNRSSSAKQALIGALLGGGVAPTTFSGGKASGGLFQGLQKNPDALSAMKTLGGQGATAQATPLQFTGGEMLKAPQLSTLGEVDNGGFLSTLARIGQLAGVASPFLPQEDDEPATPMSASQQNPNIYGNLRF
jgi:hypothetical protein